MTVINSNIGALKAQASASQNSRKLDTAMERLSTGTRINSAKDDAAGLGIANKMTAQINGLNQAIRNANDGLSMVNTIEASLQQTTSVLQRMRELAVQSANDSNSVEDRQFIQAEIVQMQSELDRIAGQGRYNGMNVLDGTFTNKQLQIGANGYETISFNVDSAASSNIGTHQQFAGTIGALTETSNAGYTTITSGAVSTVTVSTITVSGYLGSSQVSVGARDTAKDVAAAVNDASSTTGVSARAVTKAKLENVGTGHISFDLYGKNSSAVTVSATIDSSDDVTALVNAFNLVSAQTGVTAELSTGKDYLIITNNQGYDIGIENYSNDQSDGSDLDIVALSGDGSTEIGSTANLNGGTSDEDSTRIIGDILFTSSKAFTLVDSVGEEGDSGYVGVDAVGSQLEKISEIDASTASGAAAAISVIDGALAKVSNMRADLGAIASRLEKTVDALTAASTNTAAARSRILDADYSSETTNLSKAQIIAQASTAMLAQANQQPSIVLSLLK